MPQRRELHDHYFRKAKSEGYAARSAYKLLEIQERRRVLHPGDRVLDLGCAPGSWLQVAARIVGPRGVVLGIDLLPVSLDLPPHVHTFVADAFDVRPESLLETPDAPRFDTLLSDMAPSTTGDPGGDHFRSVALCRRVLALAPALLAPGGCLVMKVFEGEQYPALLRETQRAFADAKGLKPDATRDVSREMFIIARGFQARQAPTRPAPTRPARGGPPAPPPGWGESPAAPSNPPPKSPSRRKGTRRDA
ncbi:MAG: SAM-dependent methyltransferase [Phycisphaerales bacterium]